jgi:hypothetical protein
VWNVRKASVRKGPNSEYGLSLRETAEASPPRPRAGPLFRGPRNSKRCRITYERTTPETHVAVAFRPRRAGHPLRNRGRRLAVYRPPTTKDERDNILNSHDGMNGLETAQTNLATSSNRLFAASGSRPVSSIAHRRTVGRDAHLSASVRYRSAPSCRGRVLFSIVEVDRCTSWQGHRLAWYRMC